MNRIIKQDILEVEEGIICHQVNCQGVMGAGLAREVKEKWPKVFQDYRRAFDADELWLGSIQIVNVQPVDMDKSRLFVANICAQYGFGRGRRFTNYVALESGLKRVSVFSKMLKLKMFVPYGIGCGLAGGEWSRVQQILFNVSPEIIICKKPRS